MAKKKETIQDIIDRIEEDIITLRDKAIELEDSKCDHDEDDYEDDEDEDEDEEEQLYYCNRLPDRYGYTREQRVRYG